MKEELKLKGIEQGMITRIAKLSGVSITSVSKALNSSSLVSHKTMLKVANATRKVREQFEREKKKASTAIASLVL